MNHLDHNFPLSLGHVSKQKINWVLFYMIFWEFVCLLLIGLLVTICFSIHYKKLPKLHFSFHFLFQFFVVPFYFWVKKRVLHIFIDFRGIIKLGLYEVQSYKSFLISKSDNEKYRALCTFFEVTSRNAEYILRFIILWSV